MTLTRSAHNPGGRKTAGVGRPPKFWVWRWVGALLILVGTLTATYPFAAQWLTQVQEAAAAERLTRTLESVVPEQIDKQREEARVYNNLLTLGMDTMKVDYHDTISIPSGEPLARLSIPTIDLNQTVRHTLDEAVLSTGLGHMEGSSLPVGGESTNAVIGGHRGLASAVGFTRLNEVRVGDLAYLDVLGQTLTYEIISYEVLSPGDADMQPIQEGRDLLTLVTCTPIGLNTDRIVVVAERLTPGPDPAAIPEPVTVGFPWWAIAVAGGLLISSAYLLVPVIKGRQEAQKELDK